MNGTTDSAGIVGGGRSCVCSGLRRSVNRAAGNAKQSAGLPSELHGAFGGFSPAKCQSLLRRLLKNASSLP